METKLTDLCFIKKEFLSKDECASFIDHYELTQDESYYESSIDVSDRKFKQSSFSVKNVQKGSKLFDFIKIKIREALIEYQKYLDSIGIYNVIVADYTQYSHAYRILKYEKGSKIHQHLDHSYATYLTLTFNLNNNYEGGKFSFFNKKYQPELGEGDLMIFPADIFWNHEVTEILKGERYSFNSFLRSIPEEVHKVIISELHKGQYQKYIDLIRNNKNPDGLLGPYFPERINSLK